jgi:SulP family sulfate permease
MGTQANGDAPRALEYWRDAALATVASWRSAIGSGVASNISAGITVALVALPLNMALAIACGLPASVGLMTGAIAGLVGALLGGARLQITGPEVALAPISFEIIMRHGVEGLIIVTMLAGLLQVGLGVLRVGRLVHAIPLPVIGGFLAAVAIMVLDSQLPVFLGVSAEARLVTDLTPSILSSVSWPTVAVGVVVVLAMILLPRLDRRAPAPLFAVIAAMAIAAVVASPIAMVDPIEGGWPMPSLPSFAGAPLAELAAEAVALALIASIDSLLCAVSIDARTAGPRTRMDQELVAQGLANMGSACFGGMPVAAAIVRSAAAVDAGATSRVAPFSQSLVLLLVVVAFSSFVGHIPLVALASILLVVGLRLVDWKQLRHMWKSARFEVAVFGATAAGILLTDFVVGVAIGVLVALAAFAHRQRQLVRTQRIVWPTDLHPRSPGGLAGTHVFRLEGPLFFGSQAKLDVLLDDVVDQAPVVIDLAAVPTLDSSGAGALARAVDRLLRSGAHVWLTSLTPEAETLLEPVLASAGDRLHVGANLDVALRAIAKRAPTAEISTDLSSDRSHARWRRLVAFQE